MRKIYLLGLLALMPVITASAQTLTVPQMHSLIDQYAIRIKALEAENEMLRRAAAKAGVQIPLSVYQDAMAAASGATTPIVVAGASTGSIDSIATQYGALYAGFVSRIHTEWSKIREAYGFPATSIIGGYEFVKNAAADHVFVDILYSGKVGTGAYDAKLLYQYDKTTFARKLVGLFEYNKTTGFYTTKMGSNPFAGVERLFIADPSVAYAMVPNTATSTTTTSGTVTTPTTPTTVVTPPPTGTTTVTLAAIESAYKNGQYLSAITLSSNWLSANAPTVDVLRIRYRAYFVIGKYTEALAEIDKIKTMGKLSSEIACDAAIVAGYAKNTTLADAYKKICAQ